jgi:hypothetical protein
MNVEAILRTYFSGEKSEAALILLAGVACLLGAVWLWFWVRQPFARGLAASLLLVAALGLVVGGSVYFRSDAQLRQLIQLQQADPGRFAAQEAPRIRQVVKGFGLYRLGYALAILLALAFVFVVGKPLFHGLAVGLLLLAALGFTIDYFAEARAIQYVQALEAAGAIPRLH